MAKSKRVQVELRLDNVRLSFPTLFEAEAFKPGDKPAFGASLLIDKDDTETYEKIKRAMLQVAKAKWGSKYKQMYKHLRANKRLCLTDGDSKTTGEGDPMEGYEGCWVVSARSYVRPTLLTPGKKKVLEDNGMFYAGCYCNAAVAIWVQTNQFGKRINCQLQGLQFASEGDSFGGGRAADPDVFDSLADEFGDDEVEDLTDDDDFDDDDIL